MEFMGIAVGILALICALVLLFGRHGTRMLLGWSFGLLIFGSVTIAVWGCGTLCGGGGRQSNTIGRRDY